MTGNHFMLADVSDGRASRRVSRNILKPSFLAIRNHYKHRPSSCYILNEFAFLAVGTWTTAMGSDHPRVHQEAIGPLSFKIL